MWTDDDRALSLAYEAIFEADQFFVSRVTVILDAEGAALVRYDEGTGSGGHPGEVLEDCTLLFGS